MATEYTSASPLRIKTPAETLEVDYSLTQLLSKPGGLEKLAQEKLPPFIREIRDYEGFVRKVIVVHPVNESDVWLRNGEPYVYYPKDFQSQAAIYAEDGEVPVRIVEGDGVEVGVFTIMSDENVINLKRLLVQKYNYLERVRELAGQAIAYQEDTKFLALIDDLLASNPGQVVNSSNTTLIKTDMITLKQKITQWSIPVAAYLMHDVRIDDILRWGQADIDQLTMREILEQGVKYTIWGGIKLITSRAVAQKSVYAFAEPEYVGRMPVLQDLTVQLTQTANKLEKGIFQFEFVGMYLASHKAVAKLTLA